MVKRHIICSLDATRCIVCGGNIWRKRVRVGRNRPYEGTGSTLAFPLGDCTVGTSYVSHTACILCIIHHIHAHDPKLALLGKAIHICPCGKCMWHKHTCLSYLFQCIHVCTVCIRQCLYATVEGKKYCLAEVWTKRHTPSSQLKPSSTYTWLAQEIRCDCHLPVIRRLLLQPLAVLICHRI